MFQVDGVDSAKAQEMQAFIVRTWVEVTGGKGTGPGAGACSRGRQSPSQTSGRSGSGGLAFLLLAFIGIVCVTVWWKPFGHLPNGTKCLVSGILVGPALVALVVLVALPGPKPPRRRRRTSRAPSASGREEGQVATRSAKAAAVAGEGDAHGQPDTILGEHYCSRTCREKADRAIASKREGNKIGFVCGFCQTNTPRKDTAIVHMPGMGLSTDWFFVCANPNCLSAAQAAMRRNTDVCAVCGKSA